MSRDTPLQIRYRALWRLEVLEKVCAEWLIVEREELMREALDTLRWLV